MPESPISFFLLEILTVFQENKSLSDLFLARILEEPAQGGYCMHIQINDTIQWFNAICQVKLLPSSCAHLK